MVLAPLLEIFDGFHGMFNGFCLYLVTKLESILIVDIIDKLMGPLKSYTGKKRPYYGEKR